MSDQPGAPEEGSTPPPPPPPPPPVSDTPGMPGGKVDVGVAVSWAFKKFGQYAAILIGLAAVVFVIRLVQTLVSNALTNSLASNCGNTVVTDNGTIVTGGACVATLATTLTAGVITGIIFGALVWIATIGVYRAALRTSKGEAPAFADLTTGNNLGKYIVVAIVFGILTAVGLVLCVIPGLIVIFFLQFAPLYALDKGLGVGDAFRSSIDAVKKAPFPVLLAMIVNAVASFVGGWLFGILTLVALPFAALFTVHVYRQLNAEPISE